MLRLLAAAESGREAEASLAVSQERLRLARDLHDVLGHRLSIIALKAEVASDVADEDCARARREAEEIRGLAASTLREVRQAVHGYGTVDLGEQLRTAELVLASAGVTTQVSVDPGGLDRSQVQLVAQAVREAVTNILQHSDAQNVSINLHRDAEAATLVVVNDRPRPATTSPGFGLAGLAARCDQAGARLTSGRVGDRFELRVELPRR
jgi:two-component system sensor histidine kinase DesK